jgi:hypothetical protein
MMKRVTVSSSNISEIGYDEMTRTLEIVFRSGAVYQYFDVPPHIYSDLLQAASIGQYVNSNIKGYYRYARV